MSYQVLARRFRPQTFASIVGQEHVTRALANAILLNRVPHAVVLTGPRGVGKTTSARVFARALNCSGRKLPELGSLTAEADPVRLVEPCCECANCREIAKSSSLAVWEVDGASNNSVDNVRDLIDSLRSVPPPGSRYKIYIIDEVHMLSVAAFNALLKSLEEPPPNTVFIFATTEPHKIPDTVLSRCQRHDFRRLPVSVIIESLRGLTSSEKIQVDDDVLEFIAIKSRGGMRDAQSMLDRLFAFSAGNVSLENAARLFGVVDSRFFSSLSEAVLNSQLEESLSLLDQAFTQSVDIRLFVADFLQHFRNLLLVKSLSGRGEDSSNSALRRILDISQHDLKLLAEQSQSVELFDLQRLFDLAEHTARSALTSAFPRYVLEAGIVKMATLPSLLPLPEVLSRLTSGGEASEPARASAAPSRSQRKTESAAATPTSSASSLMNHSSFVKVSSGEPRHAERLEKKNEPLPAAEEPRLSDAISWEGFLSFLKDQRSEMVLAAYLRRVSPKVFVRGKLLLEAAPFDFGALSDNSMLSSLRESLTAFSGMPKWEVRVLPAGDGPVASIAVKEREELQQKRLRLEAEARNDPLIQAALSVFEGSSIERIVTTSAEED